MATSRFQQAFESKKQCYISDFRILKPKQKIPLLLNKFVLEEFFLSLMFENFPLIRLKFFYVYQSIYTFALSILCEYYQLGNQFKASAFFLR